MINLRQLVESDLAQMLEKDFALPVVLVDPDGAESIYYGQVLYDTTVEDPSSGAPVVISKPVVTLRRSSLTRIPKEGETWSIKIPSTPSPAASTETYLLERPAEDGRSIGFIRLYLIKAKQSV